MVAAAALSGEQDKVLPCSTVTAATPTVPTLCMYEATDTIEDKSKSSGASALYPFDIGQEKRNLLPEHYNV